MVRLLRTSARGALEQLYSSLAGVGAAEHFEIGEAAKTTPTVDFSKKPGG